MLVLPFPAIDPVAVAIGPISIRWYALAYVVGILIGWRYMLALAKRPPAQFSSRDIDDLVVWVTLGVVLGGRLGYVLFYRPGYYLEHPLEALMIWRGGMSFHGGLAGVIVVVLVFARLRRVSWAAGGDLLVCAAPIGLFFGRIANFVNGELFGRVSDAPWAMVFPRGGPLPRHPSQLYEAFLEGLVLFVILLVLALWTRSLERPGLLTGVFFTGYAVLRAIGELFREPDAHIGFLSLGTTMGQLLSVPVLLIGLWLIHRALRAP